MKEPEYSLEELAALAEPYDYDAPEMTVLHYPSDPARLIATCAKKLLEKQREPEKQKTE